MIVRRPVVYTTDAAPFVAHRLQHGLGQRGTRLSNVTMSDMNSDGVVDVLDCALLKRALTKK